MRKVMSEKHRRTVATVVAAAVRLPKPLRGPLHGANVRPFLRAYYANVDAEDLAGRQPAEANPLEDEVLFEGRGRAGGGAVARWFACSIRRCAMMATRRRTPSSK